MTNTPPLNAVTVIPSKYLLDGQRIPLDEHTVAVSLPTPPGESDA